MADEETQRKPSSAEDRKAASALANLDADTAASTSANVDQDAVSKAMKTLRPGTKASAAATLKNPVVSAPAAPTKAVKVDPADVALLVDQLEIPRPKATELLKSHEGDAVRAMVAFITP
ncbi:hypothetical protein VHEMI04804 [[Torrubiella] hemipterigena]|uniref:Nascent polypeptide-associated complex subunit alpha-like UBA domain-containing protein n=1 Tax=[Torrubiella] hemipterigena TaxID=1531966 RepID=A0A0A1TFC5_9HYPO|nr:hypothetical protein VHEMI04804 [[Torrubiella] hemipterigena]